MLRSCIEHVSIFFQKFDIIIAAYKTVNKCWLQYIEPFQPELKFFDKKPAVEVVYQFCLNFNVSVFPFHWNCVRAVARSIASKFCVRILVFHLCSTLTKARSIRCMSFNRNYNNVILIWIYRFNSTFIQLNHLCV